MSYEPAACVVDDAVVLLASAIGFGGFESPEH